MARPSKDPTSYTGNPPAIPGHIITQSWPTPSLDDRIIVIRKDMHAGGFRMPVKGAAFDGVQAEEMEGWKFSTAKPADQTGWIDLFYVNERANEDDYNYTISYPYVDNDYPMITRTYVVLRSDGITGEPEADAVDPVFGNPYKLTDHKRIRLDDPILDGLFVGVQRVYERLPGPVITSYQENQFQQVVVVETQTVELSPPPTLSALVESAAVDRTGTAKAVVKTGTVDSVFPNLNYQFGGEDPLTYQFRNFVAEVPPLVTSQTLAGTASVPTLGTGEFAAIQHQITEFKKEISVTGRDLSQLPVQLISYDYTADQQIATITETYDEGLLTISDPSPNALLIDAKVSNLGKNQSVRSEKTVPSVFGHQKYEKNIPELIPPRFRARVPELTSEVTSAGTASVPSLGTGELAVSDEQLTEFRHRVSRSGVDTTILPVSLVDYKMTSDQQIETVIDTLDTGTGGAPSISALTVEAESQVLGGTGATALVQSTVGTVPSVFAKGNYKRSIPDLIPARFHIALPTDEIAVTDTGPANFVALGTGYINTEQEQLTEFKRRTTIAFHDPSLLPASLVNYKMTSEQQVETIIDTLDTGTGGAPSLSALTVEAESQVLGGTGATAISLVTDGTVPSVFTHRKYQKEIPDLTSPEFRARVPALTTEVTFAGTVAVPTLDTGDLAISDEQLTVFKHRITTTNRNHNLPVGFDDDTEVTEEYGGGILKIIRTLDDESSGMTADSGLLVVSSYLKNLGNGQLYRETKQLDDVAWPALVGTEVDTQFGIVASITEQTVAAGTTGGVTGATYTEVQPKDRWRSHQTVRELDTAALAAYVLSFPGTANLNSKLPDKLESVASLFEVSTGDGSYNETGVASWSGRGSYSIPAHGSGMASASIVADATFNLIPPFFPSAPTTRWIFLLPNPVTRAAVLTRLTALVGGSVLDWAAFDPQPVTITCVSRKVSLNATANAHAHNGGDGCSDCAGSEGSVSAGTGVSTEVGIQIKIIRIPPTIHEAISIADTDDESATTQATAGFPAVSGAYADTGVVSLTATGDVSCSAAATSLTAYPATGVYLLDCQAQPYKYGYVMIHSETVDFADL